MKMLYASAVLSGFAFGFVLGRMARKTEHTIHLTTGVSSSEDFCKMLQRSARSARGSELRAMEPRQ